MDIDEPLSKEWIVGQNNSDLTRSMATTISHFSKTGFPTNKKLQTINNGYGVDHYQTTAKPTLTNKELIDITINE